MTTTNDYLSPGYERQWKKGVTACHQGTVISTQRHLLRHSQLTTSGKATCALLSIEELHFRHYVVHKSVLRMPLGRSVLKSAHNKSDECTCNKQHTVRWCSCSPDEQQHQLPRHSVKGKTVRRASIEGGVHCTPTRSTSNTVRSDRCVCWLPVPFTVSTASPSGPREVRKTTIHREHAVVLVAVQAAQGWQPAGVPVWQRHRAAKATDWCKVSSSASWSGHTAPKDAAVPRG